MLCDRIFKPVSWSQIEHFGTGRIKTILYMETDSTSGTKLVINHDTTCDSPKS